MRTIFLSGPYLSIEKFLKIKGYKNFHITLEKNEVSRFIFIVLLKHF